MLFDDHGKIERIEPYERNDAHRLIEECMLAANVCASEFLREREHAALYRVHEGPTPDGCSSCATFLGSSVSSWAAATIPTPRTTPSCWPRSRAGRTSSCCRP
jgi:exoribonuclease R